MFHKLILYGKHQIPSSNIYDYHEYPKTALYQKKPNVHEQND